MYLFKEFQCCHSLKFCSCNTEAMNVTKQHNSTDIYDPNEINKIMKWGGGGGGVGGWHCKSILFVKITMHFY